MVLIPLIVNQLMIIYNADPNLFVENKVRLLKSYFEDGLSVGDIVTLYLVPNGFFYLKTADGIFETDAKQGVHYEELL